MVFVEVASFNRMPGGTDADFMLNCNSANGLGRPDQRFSRVRLVSASIPWLVYNVDTDNDELRVTETGGGTIVATLARGNYSTQNTPAALAAALTAASAADGLGRTYTCTWDTLTGLYTIGCVAGTFTVLPPAGGRLSGLNAMLGFSLTNNSATANNVSGVRPALMSKYPLLFVHCNIVDPSSNWAALYPDQAGQQIGTTTQILGSINSAAFVFGDVAEVEFKQKRWRPMSATNIELLSFSLRDEQGNTVPIQSYWTFTLEFE